MRAALRVGMRAALRVGLRRACGQRGGLTSRDTTGAVETGPDPFLGK